MSFLFVDRILELDTKQTRGIKYVTADDKFLTRHQGDIVLLPAIVGETLGQMCAWNVMQQLDFKLRPVAGMVGEVCMMGTAKIGDRILLDTQIERLDETTVHYHAQAQVGDKTIFTLKDSFGPLLPMSEFIDEAVVRQQYARVYRPGESQTTHSQASLQKDIDILAANHGYDHILEAQDNKVVAVKYINSQADYFADHFPRKPVFPLTLLTHANLELAQQFIRKQVDVEHLNRITLSKVKMSQFVVPGDELVTTMTIKQCEAEHVLLHFKSEVDGKRVAVLKVEFNHE